jgi:D-glycero-alpha-D-manno-heptose-7-phosphate kinase
VIYSRAPARVSFGGGGSDVPPYCHEHGGAVVNTTVDRYAHAELRPGGDEVTVRSVDFDTERTFRPGRLEYTGDDLDLLRAVLNQFDLGRGFDLTVETDLPAGSGMGGSSAVAVAVAGALAELAGRPLGPGEAASLAYHAEREDLGEKGGYQDQYAAAFGGLNYVTFTGDGTAVTPLDVSESTRTELERRLLLYYTGETRESSEIHEEMDRKYRRETTDERERRDRLKAVADAMEAALGDEDLGRFGELLHEGWTVKRRLSDRISDPEIDEMYRRARENGAAGGKILGAGGGGHLLVFCDPGERFAVRRALGEYDLQPVPFRFERDGLRTWVTRDEG